jgi:hypothetical protein
MFRYIKTAYEDDKLHEKDNNSLLGCLRSWLVSNKEDDNRLYQAGVKM